MPTKQKVSARVGVATGVALVGDMSDGAISEEHGILGDTPDLAARLQSLAQPGAVIISDRTKTIAGRAIRVSRSRQSRDQGDLAKPVAAWQSRRQDRRDQPIAALQGSDLLPLIGRDEEMELLLRRWERAKSGEGQVVLLSGEAGIGKSRLTVALLEQLAREPHMRLRLLLLAAAYRQRALSGDRRDAARRSALLTMTARKRKRTSLTRCWRKARRRPRMRRCLPKCCRCPTMDATLRLKLSRSSVVRKR